MAQKSLDAVMPPAWKFPYVVRLACEVPRGREGAVGMEGGRME